jgi:hypothetical protein
LVGVILALVSLAALASVVTPGWWEPIINGQVPPAWDHGLVGLELEGRRVNSTMMDWLEITWGIQGILAWSILAIVACIGVFSLWRWRSHPLFVAILSVPIGFLLAPTAMQYDYALLTIPFMWVLGQVAHISRIRQAIIAASVAGFFSLLFLESLVSDALWFPIVLTILVFIAAPSVTSRQSAIS